MGDKFWECEKYRYENAQKWAEYFENGGHFTPEVKRQMREDNERLKELGKEATDEFLREKGYKI